MTAVRFILIALSTLTVGPIHFLNVLREQNDVMDFWICVLMVTMIRRRSAWASTLFEQEKRTNMNYECGIDTSR